MWFGIIKPLLPLWEGDMTICSPSTGNIAIGLRPRAIFPASGEQIVLLPSLKGNNCIILSAHQDIIVKVSKYSDFLSSFTISRALNGFLCFYNSKQHYATTRAPALYATVTSEGNLTVVLDEMSPAAWPALGQSNFIVSWWILMRYNKYNYCPWVSVTIVLLYRTTFEIVKNNVIRTPGQHC